MFKPYTLETIKYGWNKFKKTNCFCGLERKLQSMSCNSEIMEKLSSSVTWNTDNVPKELVNLAEEISRQNDECVSWLLLAVMIKLKQGWGK